jgi:hypothetical protein
MATDLAERLLPAFNTPTGLPYSRVRSEYNITKLHKEDYHVQEKWNLLNMSDCVDL